MIIIINPTTQNTLTQTQTHAHGWYLCVFVLVRFFLLMRKCDHPFSSAVVIMSTFYNPPDYLLEMKALLDWRCATSSGTNWLLYWWSKSQMRYQFQRKRKNGKGHFWHAKHALTSTVQLSQCPFYFRFSSYVTQPCQIVQQSKRCMICIQETKISDETNNLLQQNKIYSVDMWL